MAATKTRLSKSKFVDGVICPRRLYFQIHSPQLAAAGDEATQAMFDQGAEIGILATRAFPGGVRVEEGYEDIPGALERTSGLVKDGAVPAVFEAAFEYDGVLVFVDVLERCSKGRWRLVEVKSSTSVKDHHRPDVAIQKYVLDGCGVPLAAASLMHVNGEYVYDGVRYDPRRLFSIEDLTPEVRKLARDIPGTLAGQRRMLARKAPPDVAPDSQCLEPFLCPFYAVCNEEKPADWVGHIPHLGRRKLDALERKGIRSIPDLPAGFPLSARQARAVAAVKKRKPVFDKGLKRALAELTYPLYFMDFETCSAALPPFAGMKPYQHLPFQWSVHVRRSPKAALEHHDFLAPPHGDPRKDFLEALLDVLGRGASSKGSIVVYNASFETARLKDLARWVPGYKGVVERITARLWDLLKVMREHVYHPGFQGSFSLKAVLPALVPGMGYDGMAIAEGGQASLEYLNIVSGRYSPSKTGRVVRALREYCKKDTLALDKLLRVLEERAAV